MFFIFNYFNNRLQIQNKFRHALQKRAIVIFVLHFLLLIDVWLNFVFAGEAQIWNLGCVTQRFYY